MQQVECPLLPTKTTIPAGAMYAQTRLLPFSTQQL